MFIGFRSDVNETQWYDSTSKMAITNFPSSRLPVVNQNVCEQIAARYTYTDTYEEWIFTSQPCSEKRAHYVCEMICKATNLMHWLIIEFAF